MCCHTCAMRIPVTIASWCSVPSAPRRLVGAISPTYIGVKPDDNPAERKSWMRDRNFSIKCEGDNLVNSGVLTAVDTNDKAPEDQHFEGAAELGQPHQTPTNEGKHVVYEHGFPPGKYTDKHL